MITLWMFKGNETDTVFVQREIDANESSIKECAYVFMEGVHFREHNDKRSNYVSCYGEVEGDDDDSSIDSQL
jgi:hypothetical protein